jgi:RND family efflux transporter MFP subunit
MIKKQMIPGVAILLALSLLAGCSGGEEPQKAAPVARPVKMVTVGGDAAALTRSFPGRVAAGNQVDLSFRVGGRLVELAVGEGDSVKKGQVVARLDSRDFGIRVNSAQAQFDQADADFERLSTLYEKEAVAKAQLDQARAGRDVARAALDDARADLSDTRLRAPFAANVGAKFADNFEDVQAGQPILSLVGVDSIEVEVDLPESVIAQVRLDEHATYRVWAEFDSANGREFELELKELASQADPVTQTFRATFVMPQPDGINVLPGMTARVSGTREGGEAIDATLVVPAAAVVSGEAGAVHVWVVDETAMTVSKRTVTAGSLVGADQIEIVEGLEPGETIAVSAVSRLRDGMQVRRMEP